MNYRTLTQGAAIGRQLLFMVLAGVAMQLAVHGQPRKKGGGEPQKINPPVRCTMDEKVAVSGFTVDPMRTLPRRRVTATMTIMNRCASGTVDLNVPWKIYLDNVVIKTGTATVAAGKFVTVTAQWIAAGIGSHNFYGGIDPNNSLGDRTRYYSTLPDVVVTVIQGSADSSGSSNGQSPQLETQRLDYQKAKNAGAQFADSPDGPTGLCQYGQRDLAQQLSLEGAGVRFFVNCGGILNGARATPEAFMNFTLKNGWKIKSIDTSEEGGKTLADWNWTTRPVEGSNNPYMKMHLWSNPGGSVWVQVKVTIEGPAGTDPYHL